MVGKLRIAVAFQGWQRYFGAPIDGVVRFAQEHGGIELVDIRDGEGWSLPEEINRVRPDGVISQITDLVYREVGEDFFRMLPIVNCGRDLYSRGISSICRGTDALIRLIRDQFRKCGYGQVAALVDADSPGGDWFLGKFFADSDAEKLAAFSFSIAWPREENVHDPGPNRELQKWLLSLPKPIGVATAHGFHALWIVQECERLGLNVPDDIGIISRIDENVCLFSKPTITSVQFDGERIGYEALRLLHRLIKSPAIGPQLVTIDPTRVAHRSSTGSLDLEGEDILRSLRFIEQHATNGIRVKDVLNHTRVMSRSNFYSLFQHRVGHSPAEEIRRIKIEAAKRFLRETRLSITQIAGLSGYNSIKQFSESFRKATGITARQFRKNELGER